MDTSKKISFGFNKLVKKPLVVRTKPVEEKKVELVECLEGQSIKIKDAVETVEEPLIIPVKDNKKNLLDRIKEAKSKQKDAARSDIKQEDDRPDSELTLDEQAARALINDAKNRIENNTNSSTKVTILPIEDKPKIEGEEEATLEDYENIPINDYGMAMLRGMGWKEGMGIGKNPTKAAAVNLPELRPKGLGLGASKVVKAEQPAQDKEGNTLILKRGTYAKIIAGSHKGNYCEVQGLDDEAGRVIVKTSLKGEILNLNEFLLVPVTKEEFCQGAKVLNNAKYEEYKKISDRKLEAQRKIKDRKDSGSGDELDSKHRHSRKQRNPTRKKHASESSDYDNNSDSENEGVEKSRKRDVSDDEDGKYKERSTIKYRDKKPPSSDSDDKYEKSRNKYRDSSDSDSRRRKKKGKDKKKKKDRDRDRSRSQRGKEKSSSKKSDRKKERSKDRSASYDHKPSESSKKHKSKSSHRRRSSSSSGSDHRRSRR